jgi:hypothetical protein
MPRPSWAPFARRNITLTVPFGCGDDVDRAELAGVVDRLLPRSAAPPPMFPDVVASEEIGAGFAWRRRLKMCNGCRYLLVYLRDV